MGVFSLATGRLSRPEKQSPRAKRQYEYGGVAFAALPSPRDYRNAQGSFRHAAKATRKANEILRKQLEDPELLPVPDIAELSAQFREEFEAALTDRHLEIAEHTNVAHADMVARDLKGRKPFGSSGREEASAWEPSEDLDGS